MMLILISFWGLSTYQRDAFRKAYGLSEQVDLFNSNSTQVFNRLTRSSQEEIRRQIFAPFFSTSRGKSGIGHGLAVCRGLVREMGGRIFLERGDPGSTVFTVRLPFIPCRPESDA